MGLLNFLKYFKFQFNMKLLVIFTLIFGLALGSDDIVTISQGKLKGSTLKSRNGRKFKAFQGIPYAKPPINDLRFKVNHIHLCNRFKNV